MMYRSTSTQATIDWRRLAVAGVVAVVLSLAANGLVRGVTLLLFDISPEFRPFTWPQLTLFTVIGVVGATLAYAWVLRRSPQPATRFRNIALVVLLLSFLPDVGLLVSQAAPGMTIPAFWTLIVMHVATAAITVPTLIGWGSPRGVVP